MELRWIVELEAVRVVENSYCFVVDLSIDGQYVQSSLWGYLAVFLRCVAFWRRARLSYRWMDWSFEFEEESIYAVSDFWWESQERECAVTVSAVVSVVS